MKKMNPEWKAKWLVALRSGKYKQGNGILLDDEGGYCCLGVLQSIVGAPCKGDFLDPKVAREVGLPNLRTPMDDLTKSRNPQARLAVMNDGLADQEPRSFLEIADWIEEHL